MERGLERLGFDLGGDRTTVLVQLEDNFKLVLISRLGLLCRLARRQQFVLILGFPRFSVHNIVVTSLDHLQLADHRLPKLLGLYRS